MTTEAQVSANRRNAAKSTGPKTTVGKAIVAQNAITHGLRACQDVVLEEDQGEFDLHRQELLADLRPVGTLEATLAGRIVSLTWRLQRAERLQNEVFDSLLAEELRDSMEDFEDDLSPEDERELRGDPSADPRLAVGRMVARDFSGEKVLERLLSYERQIEGILRRTMADLEHLQVRRRAEAEHNPPCGTDSDKQSQSPGLSGAPFVETQDVASARSVGVNDPSCAKQSQIPADASCRTKPTEACATDFRGGCASAMSLRA